MAKCPKCGSTQVTFRREAQGTSSQSHYYRVHKGTSLFTPAGKKTYRSTRRYATIGLCKQCGHCWKKETFADRLWAVIGILLIVSVFFAAVNSPEEEKTMTMWAEKATSLSDFKYYIDQEQIILKKYLGDAKEVNIAAAYDVDGESMDVVALEGTFVAKKGFKRYCSGRCKKDSSKHI